VEQEMFAVLTRRLWPSLRDVRLGVRALEGEDLRPPETGERSRVLH
jgi:hypothetical protein